MRSRTLRDFPMESVREHDFGGVKCAVRQARVQQYAKDFLLLLGHTPPG